MENTSIIIIRYYWIYTYTYVTRFEKTNHFNTTGEMHFSAPYHRYTHALSKNIDRIKTDCKVYFPQSTQLFPGCAKNGEASTDSVGTLRMAWMQSYHGSFSLSIKWP